MEKTGKILAIYLLIISFAAIFVIAAARATGDSHQSRVYTKHEAVPAFRGSIITADWRVLSQSERRFNLAFDGKDAANKTLIAKLLAIFLQKSEAELLEALSRETRVILARGLNVGEAKALKNLSLELDRRGAFKTHQINGNTVRHGLDVLSENPHTRLYEYGDLAQPILGYTGKADGEAKMGVEKFYDSKLRAAKDGLFKAPRDALGNLIYNNQMRYEAVQNGFSLQLTIDSFLQKELERLVDKAQKDIDASEIICAIMESGSGKLLAIATSARYDAENITNDSVANTRINAVQYPFEPGSVMKPFIVALLLDDNQIGQYDLVRGYNGKMSIGRETITDLTPREWFSVEDVIVYSSNIGAAQLAMQLSPYKLFDGLSAFGFAKSTGIDLPYESTGDLPGLHRYRTDIYRATTGYGYGLRATFMQLMKAYNVFNNGGVMVAPRLAKRLIGESGGQDGKDITKPPEQTRVISEATALKLMQIMRKTAMRGQVAVVDDIFTAGKTGTAHIARAGIYLADYHNSFFGFANRGDKKYTIGVFVIDPKKSHFANQTAAPVFVSAINLLKKHDKL
ncbi:MAG: penicillin-binding protein 2 [Helicobacteraceae bacterium]|jgi:cell division protein FtsI (penicillin-binding protein 3)|nr:penicillin-binding protein 2 [Helicobacteraceae bacterium]